MRIAIVYGDTDIWIEFTPEKFTELLRTYLEQYHDLDQAMKQIVEDIRRETRYK